MRWIQKWFHRSPQKSFTGSSNYWIKRYATGGNSGDGSYNELANFKAKILNDFVTTKKIQRVIELGCGDGNQLKLANYPNYVGYDISSEAIALCQTTFADDNSKSFRLMQDFNQDVAELSLSLDVIYHLIEDDVFNQYMTTLFKAASDYVIIYSSNTEENPVKMPPHVKHRQFSSWIALHQPDWQLIEHIPNQYPYNKANKTGSFADFFIYQKHTTNT